MTLHKNLILLPALILIITCQQPTQPSVPAQQVLIPIQTPTHPQQNPPLPQTPTIPQQTHGSEQIKEMQQESKIQQSLNEQLPTWISEQLQQIQSLVELPITETFAFVLKSQEEKIFKWDPSKEKELKLIVNVFYLTSSGGITVIKDADEDEFVEITVKNPNAVFFGLIGKVYRTKIITVDFDTDYKQLKFFNKNSQPILIQIDIQKLNLVVQSGVPDNQLTTTRSKIQSILTLSQSTQIRRQHLYKWQWGFIQNQKNHEMQILGLTGVELFAILMTACVQMYCLKGLLDNRAVV